VGTFLLLKEPYANLITNLNSNNAYQLINYDANLSSLIDESVDDKIKKELKFHILSEEDMVGRISELNPSFKRKTTAFSSINSNTNNSVRSPAFDEQQVKINGDSHGKHKVKKEANAEYAFDNDVNNSKETNDSLKRLKQEQEQEQLHLNRSKQAQFEIAQKILQEEREKQLNLQFQNNVNMLQLQFNTNSLQQQQQEQHMLKTNQKQLQMQQQQNFRLQQHQERQQQQQKVKIELIEAKRKEKYLQRERKTREKW
jgi:hypothetical protein